MRHLFVAGFVVALASTLGADPQVIPLVDPSDPIRIVTASIEFEDDIRPVVVVEFENQTDSPIETRSIWIQATRFYTKREMERASNRKLWDCGHARWAGSDKASQTIQPHGRVVTRLPIVNSCEHNRDHEHFFLIVQRIGTSFSEPYWKRESGELSRLLAAAMPHP